MEGRFVEGRFMEGCFVEGRFVLVPLKPQMLQAYMVLVTGVFVGFALL